MANAVLTPAGSSPVAGVTQRLRRIRARIGVWFLVDGFSRFFAAAVVLIAFDLLVDWAFELDRPQRIVMLGLMLAALAFVVWRRIVRPFRERRISDDALALQVEQQNATLGESLISALQFSRGSRYEETGVSSVMVAATIDRGVNAAAGVSFDAVLRTDRFLFNAVLLAASLAALGGVAWGAGNWVPLGIWYDRNLLLADDVEWPHDTRFRIDGVEEGVLTVPRGDDWLLVAHVDPSSKVFPDAAEIEVRAAGGRRSEVMKPVNETAGKRDGRRKRFEYPFMHVVEPFQFRGRSSSGRTPWIQVRLVDRPEVNSKTLALTATQPEYAGGKTATLPSGRGPHYVLKGSRLRVAGSASKVLWGAELLVSGQALPMAVDGKQFSVDVPADKVVGETYRIRLIDTLEIQFPNQPKPTRLESNPHTKFRLKIRPDAKPQLTVKLIGVGGMVVPGARIPCVVRVKEDFNITAARLKYERRHRDDPKPTAGGDPLAPVNAELRDASKQPWKSLVVNHAIDLKPLKIAPGSSFSFFFEADDNDTVSGPKTGKTQTLTIRVVSEEELRADLQRREIEQAQEFERLLTEQDKIKTETNAILARYRGKPDVPAKVREQLRDLQKQQATIGKNLSRIADKLESIVQEFRNNRLADGESQLQKRETQIIRPIRALASKAIPQVVTGIAQARKNTTRPQPRDAALNAVVKKQGEIVTAMTTVLGKMTLEQGLREILNKTYRVKKAQQSVKDKTEAEKRKLLKGFEPKPGDKTPPKPKKPKTGKKTGTDKAT
ncbi:MAG: hypothetical protein ACE5KM_00430 [Planctomycetaceae bacterium]